MFRFNVTMLLAATLAIFAVAAHAGAVPPANESVQHTEDLKNKAKYVKNAVTPAGMGLKYAAKEIVRGAGEIDARDATNWTLRKELPVGTARQIRQGYAQAGEEVAESIAKDVKTVKSVAGYVADGAEVLAIGNKYRNGDEMGAAQDATDFAVSKGVAAAATGLATATGMACPLCGAAGGLGFAAGKKVRELDTCMLRDCGPGKKYTIQDGVTDLYYGAYEKIDFALHPEKDPMSEEFERIAMDKATENRHRYEESARNLQNLQQQKDDADRAAQVEAAQQAAAAAAANQPSGGGIGEFMGALLTGTVMLQEQQALSNGSTALPPLPYLDPAFQAIAPPTPLAPEPAPSAGFSPGGGACHPNHDEKAHPGGCHKSPISSN